MIQGLTSAAWSNDEADGSWDVKYSDTLRRPGPSPWRRAVESNKFKYINRLDEATGAREARVARTMSVRHGKRPGGQPKTLEQSTTYCGLNARPRLR